MGVFLCRYATIFLSFVAVIICMVALIAQVHVSLALLIFGVVIAVPVMPLFFRAHGDSEHLLLLCGGLFSVATYSWGAAFGFIDLYWVAAVFIMMSICGSLAMTYATEKRISVRGFMRHFPLTCFLERKDLYKDFHKMKSMR